MVLRALDVASALLVDPVAVLRQHLLPDDVHIDGLLDDLVL